MGFNSGNGFVGSSSGGGGGSSTSPSTKSLTNTIASGTITTIAHGIATGSTVIKSISVYTSDNRFLNDSFADWYWNDTNIIIDSDTQYLNAKFYIEYIN